MRDLCCVCSNIVVLELAVVVLTASNISTAMSDVASLQPSIRSHFVTNFRITGASYLTKIPKYMTVLTNHLRRVHPIPRQCLGHR